MEKIIDQYLTELAIEEPIGDKIKLRLTACEDNGINIISIELYDEQIRELIMELAGYYHGLRK